MEGGEEHPGGKDSRNQGDKKQHGVCEEVSAVTRCLPHFGHTGFGLWFLLLGGSCTREFRSTYLCRCFLGRLGALWNLPWYPQCGILPAHWSTAASHPLWFPDPALLFLPMLRRRFLHSWDVLCSSCYYWVIWGLSQRGSDPDCTPEDVFLASLWWEEHRLLTVGFHWPLFVSALEQGCHPLRVMR